MWCLYVQDLLKDFLDKKDRGELMIQKATSLLKTILKEVSASLKDIFYDNVGSQSKHITQPTPLYRFINCKVDAGFPESPLYKAESAEDVTWLKNRNK